MARLITWPPLLEHAPTPPDPPASQLVWQTGRALLLHEYLQPTVSITRWSVVTTSRRVLELGLGNLTVPVPATAPGRATESSFASWAEAGRFTATPSSGIATW